jgi:hypothetical protein
MITILKNILADLSLVYKNFIHWNISKVIIYVWALLLGILLSLPFFLLLAWIVFLDPIDWKDIIATYNITNSVGLSFLTAISTYYVYIIIEFFIFVLWVAFFSFWYSYYIIPLTNLYINYLKWVKLSFFSNIYFNFKKIFSYISILIWGTMVFFIPLVVFILWFFISLLLLWGIENVFQAYEQWTVSIFSVIIWIIFLICFLIFIYLAYRVSFAYVILLDKDFKFNEEKNKIIGNKIMIWVIVINVIFILLCAWASYYFLWVEAFIYITLFIAIISWVGVFLLYALRKYLSYIIESIRMTSWIKFFKFLLVVLLYSIVMSIIEFLGWFLYELWSAWYYLFSLLSFLFTFGLFEMLFVTSYRNIMMNGIMFKSEETVEVESLEEIEINENEINVVEEEKIEVILEKEEKNDNK